MFDSVALAQIANSNLVSLGHNPYPGRGMILGIDQTGQYALQVYWIMGRSKESKNRRLSVSEGRVFTELADLSQQQDTSLIIYNAMCRLDTFYVVSNGSQTDRVILRMQNPHSNLLSALVGEKYEPDGPNFTPRITGVSRVQKDGTCWVELAILRKSLSSEACEKACWHYDDIPQGFGYGIWTYSDNGSPLPSFRGNEPFLLPLPLDTDYIANLYWDKVLSKNFRVALAVKRIDLQTGESVVKVINALQRVPAMA